MQPEEQVELCEKIAERLEKQWREEWSNSTTTGPLVYWRDIVPYKAMVRDARLKAQQAICWGAVDCLDEI